MAPASVTFAVCCEGEGAVPAAFVRSSATFHAPASAVGAALARSRSMSVKLGTYAVPKVNLAD